jgi:hypothetical protein
VKGLDHRLRIDDVSGECMLVEPINLITLILCEQAWASWVGIHLAIWLRSRVFLGGCV